MTDDGVLALLRQRLTGVASTFLHPTIPAKKLNGVRTTHAAYLPPAETILAVYDGTVFGSATDGFYVTSKRLGFKNQLDAPEFIDWPNVDPDSIYVDGTRVVVGAAEIDTLYGKDEAGLWAWTDVLETLARSANPSRAGAVAHSGAGAARRAGPSAWDAVPAAWAPPPPSYGHHPIVEQLPTRPYPYATSCSVVDVDSTGRLFALCVDATVDVRYAANAARFRAFQAPEIVLAAKFAPNAPRLAVGGLDGKATLYDVESCRILGATQKLADGVDHVVWLGTSGQAAIGSQRGEVVVIDGATGQVVQTILGADPEYATLGGLAATADGRVLFVSLGRRIGAFDTASGKILWRFDDALTNAAELTVSPRGDVLVAAGYDGVALFDARTGQPGARYPLGVARSVSWPESEGGLFAKRELAEHSWSPRPRFSPRGDVVAVQDHAGNLAFIDGTSYALHATPRDRGRAWIEDLAWFPDGEHLLVGASDNTFAIWRIRPLTLAMHAAASA